MKNGKITNAIRLLRSAGIDFDIIEYDEEVGDNFGERVAARAGLDPDMSFKTLAAKGDKSGYITVCVNVNSEIDLKRLAGASGNKKVELVHTKDLLAVTGYMRGCVSPIGMKKKFPVYIDAACERHEKMAVSGGVCGITLVLNTNDFIEYTNAKVCEIGKER